MPPGVRHPAHGITTVDKNNTGQLRNVFAQSPVDESFYIRADIVMEQAASLVRPVARGQDAIWRTPSRVNECQGRIRASEADCWGNFYVYSPLLSRRVMGRAFPALIPTSPYEKIL